jgi:hypothetical protein
MDVVGLDDARLEARKVAGQVAQGGNPSVERRAKRQSKKLGDVIKEVPYPCREGTEAQLVQGDQAVVGEAGENEGRRSARNPITPANRKAATRSAEGCARLFVW